MAIDVENKAFESENNKPNDVRRNSRERKGSSVRNPHLDDMNEDILYHLALSTSSHDLQEMFGDVKFVCVGGTGERMHILAHYVCQALGHQLPPGGSFPDICKISQRYTMYKAGPVLCVSHGIGSPSISIMLHEVMKLMHHAEAEDVIFLRIGTCGGIGLEPGSIAITSEAVDGLLRPYQELSVLGRLVRRPSVLDEDLARELKDIGDRYLPQCTTVVGKTMCADDFYEGQGRLDGAFCEFSHQDKMTFLQQLRDKGIINIEMESLTFSAMCMNAGIKAGVVCVTLLDRLKEDQVAAPKEILEEWQQRLLLLTAMFIKEKLSKS